MIMNTYLKRLSLKKGRIDGGFYLYMNWEREIEKLCPTVAQTKCSQHKPPLQICVLQSARLLVRRLWVRFQLRPPAPYWLGRCQYNVTGWDRSHGLPALSRVWQQVKLLDISLGTRPRYSLVADEDVDKKQNKQQAYFKFKIMNVQNPYKKNKNKFKVVY